MREKETPTLLSRRQILASGVAMAGAIPLLRMPRAAAAPETRAANLRLTAGTRTLDVHGKSARVFGLAGPNGKPGITLSPGDSVMPGFPSGPIRPNTRAGLSLTSRVLVPAVRRISAVRGSGAAAARVIGRKGIVPAAMATPEARIRRRVRSEGF